MTGVVLNASAGDRQWWSLAASEGVAFDLLR
jgi:hypothetical protein